MEVPTKRLRVEWENLAALIEDNGINHYSFDDYICKKKISLSFDISILSQYLQYHHVNVKKLISNSHSCVLYINECVDSVSAPIQLMFAIHPNQHTLERSFQKNFRQFFCYAFVIRILQEYIDSNNSIEYSKYLKLKEFISNNMTEKQFLSQCSCISFTISSSDIFSIFRFVSSTVSSSLATAYLYCLLGEKISWLQDVSLVKCDQNPHFSRIIITLVSDETIPRDFQFIRLHQNKSSICYIPLISLIFHPETEKSRIHSKYHEELSECIANIWKSVEISGYDVSTWIQNTFSPILFDYFNSAINIKHSNSQFQLISKFQSSNFAYYVHGLRGSGKSSFIQHFTSVLEPAIRRHLDPNIVVKSISINLNKTLDELERELYIRPNNNDNSLLGIINGVLSTVTTNRNCILAMIFEEIPSPETHQIEIFHLLRAKLFSKLEKLGKKLTYLTFFSSNYVIADDALRVLQSSFVTKNVQILRFPSPQDSDHYRLLKSRFNTTLARLCGSVVNWDINLSSNVLGIFDHDIRISYTFVDSLVFWVLQYCSISYTSVHKIVSISLECGSNEHISVFINPSVGVLHFDYSTIYQGRLLFPSTNDKLSLQLLNSSLSSCNIEGNIMDKLNIYFNIISLYFVKQVLIPCVIIVDDGECSKQLTSIVSNQVKLAGNAIEICDFDLSEWKLSRNLYDHPSTKTVRDEIKLIRNDPLDPFIVVKFTLCGDDNFCAVKEFELRDLLQDLPATTAFSTSRSHLTKNRLMFIVEYNIENCSESKALKISPEIKSRASWISLIHSHLV